MKSVLGGMVGGVLAVLLLAGLASFSWYYFLEGVEEETGEFDKLDLEWADQSLREAMLSVESYQRTFGFYPETLELALDSSEIYDPLAEDCECGDSIDFFYQVLGDGSRYTLFSKGPDCKPFTEDDHHPDISEKERPSLGISNKISVVAVADTGGCDDT